jgi:2-keto-4-pentenoate hydratase/2-oxohepta-3-ene-1,7-dioic acid hydratase in catechol pathway
MLILGIELMDKIICVGKNYLEHAKEMRALQGEAGNALPDSSEMPALFLKPPSIRVSATGNTPVLLLPPDQGEVHHECEIVVRVRASGYRMSLAEAEAAIGAVTLGLDMTLRDLQGQLKKKGQPWEISKIFPGSAVTGPWLETRDFPNWLEEPFSLAIDGELRQQGRGTEMRLSPAEALAYASRFFPIVEGDLLFTGTPAGVGPVRSGQLGELRWGKALRYEVRWQ